MRGSGVRHHRARRRRACCRREERRQRAHERFMINCLGESDIPDAAELAVEDAERAMPTL